MSNENYKNYLKDLIFIIKEQAKEAKLEADHPKEGLGSFNKGMKIKMWVNLEKKEIETAWPLKR